MDAERYARIRELYDKAQHLEPPLRAAYLENECAGDTPLRDEVEDLLRASDRAEGTDNVFADDRINRQREALDRLRPGQDTVPPVPHSAGIPERIDQYRITRRIATGGMGTVYEALQDHPKRTVAIKMIDPRRSSPTLVSRFRRETEILGRLKHPGIAQIYDAGTIDLGEGAQPYLVMEYVEGEPLTKYADDAKLDTDARLELLARVCDAVDYAHRQGVIHRDLKPDNVLVESDGRPKVLDFGIARATDDSTMVATQVTQDGQLLGTLAYMAPEQLGGDHDSVVPATDVYALGVIAYELLADRLPHDVAGLSLGNAVRVLTEDDTARLSTLDTRLRGDVETIVGTALDKDIARRYPSAAVLATDIRRYLANEPITARPATRLYRVRKFTRRNRILVGGVTATMLALVAGLVVAVVLGAREREQRLASERMAYRTSVLAATRALAEREPIAAAAYLADAPEAFRGWEWHELTERLDRSVRTIEHGHDIRGARRAPDGSWYLTNGIDGIRTWDTATGKLRLTIEGKSAAIRHAGGEIVYLSEHAGAPSWIEVRDSRSGTRISRHPVDLDAHTGRGRVTPDGGTFLTYAVDRLVTIEIDTGKVLHTSARRPAGRPTGNLDVSPDGKLVVHSLEGGDLALVSLPGLEPIAEIETVSDRLQAIAFSPDGARLVVGHYNGSVQVWDMTSGMPRELYVKTDHERAVMNVAFSPDGTLLATASYKTVRLLDIRTGAPRAVFAGGQMIETLVFSPDGTRLVCPQRYGVVRIWDTTPPARGVFSGHRGYAYDMALTPDTKTLLTVGWDGHQSNSPGCVRWWDAASGHSFAAWGDTQTHAIAAAISPDGRVAAVLLRRSKDDGLPGHDGRLVLFDMATCATIGSASMELGKNGDVEFDRSGRLLLIANATSDGSRSRTATINVLDLATLDPVAELAGNFATWSPSGRRLAMGTGTGTLELRDGNDFTIVRSWSATEKSNKFMTFDAEGRRLVTTGRQDPAARVWDVSTGEPLAALLGNGGTHNAAFSPDGTRLATCGGDKLVRIWRTDTWELVSELHGHVGYVRQVLWTPDGQRLFSCGQDGDVRVWDARPATVRRAAGEERRRLVMQLAPRVEALFAELDDAAAVVARLEADATLSGRAREVALQLAFGEAVARKPDGVRVEE